MEAQPKPDSLIKSLVTLYPVENLESRVYYGLDADQDPVVDSRIAASGSTTHLQSLKISVITLKENQHVSANEQGASENLIIIKTGELLINIDNDRNTLGPGSVAFILPGDIYSMQNLQRKPATYYLLEYQSKSPVNPSRGRKAGGSFVVHWNDVHYRSHDKGGRRDFFDRPTAMCEDFEMHVTNLNQNTSSHAPHTHEVEEIILMVQGKIRMHIDGKEMEASEGDFAFIDSQIPHAPTNIGPEQAIYFAFQWK